MGARERLATMLYKAGALGAVMRVRGFAPGPTVSIVTYHHVAEDHPASLYDPGVADATPAQFRRQMEMLAKHGSPIGIDELVRALDGGPLPKNPAMVTFDDGYRSCHDVALPILRAVGIRATFFVPTSFIGERRLYWWERIAFLLSTARVASATIAYPHSVEIVPREDRSRRALTDIIKNTPSLDIERFLDELAVALHVEWDREIETRHADDVVMTWDHVRALSRAGMDVESHSRRHRVLQTLDAAALRDELAGSKADLEQELGRPIRAIAYPVGRRVSHVPMIREAVLAAGYRVGLSNGSGATRIWPRPLSGMMATDRFDVRRLSTDRTMSDAMYLTQMVVPWLAYVSRHSG